MLVEIDLYTTLKQLWGLSLTVQITIYWYDAFLLEPFLFYLNLFFSIIQPLFVDKDTNYISIKRYFIHYIVCHKTNLFDFFHIHQGNSIFFVECHIYLNTFISLILSFSKCQNRKITFVFSVNLCFLMLSFWGLLILLFLICFFRHFTIPISLDYQYVTSNQ